MHKVKWLVGASLAVLVAGCVDGYGYPTTSYGYSNGYYNRPTYYRPTYYRPVPVMKQSRYHRYRDRDRDGIPDRYDRDRNGDGIPDRWRRRGW